MIHYSLSVAPTSSGTYHVFLQLHKLGKRTHYTKSLNQNTNWDLTDDIFFNSTFIPGIS
jgi:hypothetical protein